MLHTTNIQLKLPIHTVQSSKGLSHVRGVHESKNVFLKGHNTRSSAMQCRLRTRIYTAASVFSFFLMTIRYLCTFSSRNQSEVSGTVTPCRCKCCTCKKQLSCSYCSAKAAPSVRLLKSSRWL